MSIHKKIRVLVVDDSSIVRQTLSEIFNSDPEIEVIGTAANPYLAVQKIKDSLPDVISLDVEMPRMDGITFLKKIMSQHPIPVVIISTLTEAGTEVALKALAHGAIEVVAKPKIHTRELLQESTIMLCDAIKAAYHASPGRRRSVRDPIAVPKKLSADAILEKQDVVQSSRSHHELIAIGSSTGGTEALRHVLTRLPNACPGIVVVQHMPEGFTLSFANRLNDLCTISVKEAADGDIVTRGTAFIVPGNKHVVVKRRGSNYVINVVEGPLVNRHRPSVDVLFRSVAQSAGRNSVGIILTGMGDDGARGLLEMKEAGAETIAQDEESCIVFGMPKEAIKLGAAIHVEALDTIASKIMLLVRLRRDAIAL